MEVKEGAFAELIDLVQEGKLRIVIDDSSSTLTDLNAVKRAFHTMERRAAHGKVVVRIDD